MSQSPRLCLFALVFFGFNAAHSAWAVGGERYVEFSASRGALTLVKGGVASQLVADSQDWPGVLRATRNFQADVKRVTGVKPVLQNAVPAKASDIVIVGTIGKSAVIDALVASGKLDVASVKGKWEAWVRQVVANPAPGIDRALVIAGSDKRGTIYGIYDVSEQIGVSPWYWWADVASDLRDALFVKAGRFVQGEPSVKYRGIFLNDEAPDLTNWVRAKLGNAPLSENPPVPAGVANYNSEFYGKLFEVILRMRGNYLWPAMWSNAFNEDDPKNAALADEYGVVMGTSHQEPMLRAQKEWDRRYRDTLGNWNYAKTPDVMQNFWREGVRRNKNFESIITMGLRGANDTEMAPGGPQANRALLEQIVDVQRKMLAEEINPDLTKIPQVWCLYKEVQAYYESGMRVPDDVTLLWAEDNWGNVRRLPTAAERQRSGGAGIYYHFDYHGGPRSYQWLNTNPLAKIWDQMSLAKQYGADRVWIVNVGHFKGYELPMEYFLALGWDANRWTNSNVNEFTRLWAEREFGPSHAAEIAEVVGKYSKFNNRRKPELLAPDTYSLSSYHEAETVVAEYNALAVRAETLSAKLPAAKRDAFYQLVLYPTRASAIVNELYLDAGKNLAFAKQGRASANQWSVAAKGEFQKFMTLTKHFNGEFAGGKWAHFMDQPVLGYTTWRDPPTNNLDHIKFAEVKVPEEAALGVAVEGSAAAWPGAAGEAELPKFDAFNRQRRYIDVFNKGKTAFGFTATSSAPWMVLSATKGSVGEDQRLWVSIDWQKAPKGEASATVKISGAGTDVTVKVVALNPTEITSDSLQGFVEGEGVVSIEAEHYTKKNDAGPTRWIKVEDYGRTLSGMRAEAPVDAPPLVPDQGAPSLEYKMFLFGSGTVDVSAITAPTLNFIPNREVRYAVSFDDRAPVTVTLVPKNYTTGGGGPWAKSVTDSAHYGVSKHTLETGGYHTLKIWMIDPGVMVQKLIVNLGGLKPSYLGPPESFRGTAKVGGKPGF